jgi:vacuolar-type H+-ATPase subunit I/STV1
MDPSCIICSESFIGCKDIYSTKCGHYSHRSCLSKWLDKLVKFEENFSFLIFFPLNRAKTCPECRASCTSREIFKIFFTFDSETTGIALNNKMDQNREEIKKDIDKITQRFDEMKSAQELRMQDNQQQIQLIQKQLKDQLKSEQDTKKHQQKKIEKLEKRLKESSGSFNSDAFLYLIVVGVMVFSYFVWFK